MKLQVYITQPFEQSNFKWKWTNRLYKKLDLTKINFYDPQYEEQRKTGKSLIEDINLTHNYFINKDYNKLQKTMDTVWWAKKAPKNKIQYLYKLKQNINKNKWGDIGGVINSDFIIAYLPPNCKTVGAHYEMFLAYLFNIPIYLIMPGVKYKTRLMKSKLFNKSQFMVVNSAGGWFWTIKDCINFIKKKYNI